jgi:hypothetical protein
MSRRTPYAWLRSWTVDDLKALVWHYALTAPNGHPTRFVDPRQMKKKALAAHITTQLPDAAEPTAADRAAMKTAFSNVTESAMLALAALVISSQQTGIVAPLSPASPNASSDDDAKQVQEGDGSALPLSVSSPLAVSDPPPSVASGAQVSLPSSARPIKRRREEDTSIITLVTCPARCGKKVNSEDESSITFCPGCGKPWRETPPANSSATSSASTNVAAPKVWGGAATWNPPSMAQAIPETPLRTLALAPVQESLVKRAREGQSFISLYDCMQSHAVQGASTTNVDLDRTFVMQFNDGGTVTRATDAVARAAQSAAERKRTINSFADIMEIFIHTLIAVIYVDRPDICVQLYALLIQAADISREYDNWKLALNYIEFQCLQHFRKAGQPPIHVLAIATDYNMGRFSQEALDAARNRLTTTTTPSASGRKSSVPGSCRDWNYGAGCARSQCRYSHLCSLCASPSHPALECTQYASRSSPVPPSQPNSGRGGRGARGRGGRQPSTRAAGSPLPGAIAAAP